MNSIIKDDDYENSRNRGTLGEAQIEEGEDKRVNYFFRIFKLFSLACFLEVIH